jgi:DNA mismatch repair protein MutS
MIRQYLEIKNKHRDAILFFRLGDFYEMFFEDAKVASGVLNIALTSRNKGKEDSVPLCGVPYHSVQGYIDTLISKGYKVAICEQVEDPKTAKNIVKREVVQIITPGLLTEGNSLDAKSNNYLISISGKAGIWGIAYLDISTGSFNATNVSTLRDLTSEITRIKPKEALVSELSPPELSAVKAALNECGCSLISNVDEWVSKEAAEIIKRNFKLSSLESIGFTDERSAVPACAAIIHYAGLTQKTALSHIQRPRLYSTRDYMVLDPSTVRNLELIDGNEGRSLFSTIDNTLTPMGGRRLKEWILFPLVRKEKIEAVHEAVQEMKDGKTRYLIGNNHGRINGWTTTVYGVAIKVED